MLPNKKMAQFKDNPDWHATNIAAVESLVRKRFTETYDNSIRTEGTMPVCAVLPPVSFILALVRSRVQY